MAKKWWEIFVVFLALLILAIVSTYPLILHFDTGIPYAPFGGAKVWNKSGDQIQLMYWFWLVKENFLGHVPFDSNPFEFNMAVPYETSGLNTIPLAFLYMLFSPLGDIAAYNSTIICSYLFAGVFMYLLVRLYSGSRTGAMLAAIIFTFAPSRIRGFTAGHGYGFLYFCYPFILYFLEKGIRSEKIRYGFVSSIGLIGLSMLEPHLIYYFCVFLGLYIPVRIISLLAGCKDEHVPVHHESPAPLVSLALIWGAGAAVSIYSQCFFSVKDQTPFFTPIFWWIIALYPLAFVSISLCLSALYQRVSCLHFQESLWLEAKSLMPLYLFLALWVVLLESWFPIHTDRIVISSVAVVIVLKIWFFRMHIYSLLHNLLKGVFAQWKAVLPILPLVLSMAGIVNWMASSKVEQVAATIVGGGRTLGDVGLFSARLADLFSSISNVYIGVVPAVLCGGFLVWLLLHALFAKNDERFTEEADLLALFYMTIAFCCLILALGLAFGNVSLYALFFHYFPFFHYPRVSDRIITLALFGLAIVSGYVVKSILQRCQGKASFTAVALLFFAAMGLQLKDYNIFKPMGINILDKGQDIYTYVKKNIGDGLLLEIPLWPGDSHQSSLYQHYIMLDRIPRINGNSPMVLKKYIDDVFTPLASINQGRLDRRQFELLHDLGVNYLTVHDNRDVFPKKVSPFVPLTTVRRLANSPYLELLDIDNNMYFKTYNKKNVRLSLFRVKSKESVLGSGEQAWYDMPCFYDVNWRLHRQTGGVATDSSIGKNVFQAKEGKDKAGFLVYGPYDIYPPGEYLSTFLLSAEGEIDAKLARLEVSVAQSNGEVTVLAQQFIVGIGRNSGYIPVVLPFSIKEETKLEFRVFFYGKGMVRVEKIKVNKLGKSKALYMIEAEKMVGNTGAVASVQDASGGTLVQAVPHRNKKGIMVYGPNRSYGEGFYTARFFLRTIGKTDHKNMDSVVAELSVTDGQSITQYAIQNVNVSQLNNISFSAIDVEFELPRSDDLSFKVYFTGRAGLQLDKIEILPQ
ncbi:MAG: hypothetical protein U9R57_03930 [Thermodesulfobacteriota bacterium]|nr:hypothetical protein [Thermodesulfobacteriota bacterium]